MEKRSIIKQSTNIREKLQTRFEELGFSYTQITAEATRFGQTNINVSTLSRYFSGQTKNSLTESSIIFLCYRYGIVVSANVNVLPYNENECIKNVLLIFPEAKNLVKEPIVNPEFK